MVESRFETSLNRAYQELARQLDDDPDKAESFEARTRYIQRIDAHVTE